MIQSEKKVKCSSPKIVGNIIGEIIKSYDEFEQDKEHFYVIGMNIKNVIQYIDLVSIGTISEAIVHPREVFRMAIHKGVASILIAHNHPSGETHPSDQDIITTKRLREAGEILGISVLDHVIVAETNYRSLKEDGYL